MAIKKSDFDGDRIAEIPVTSPWGIGILKLSGSTLTSSMMAPNGTRFGGWLLNTADNCFDKAADFSGDGKSDILVTSPWGIGILRLSGDTLTMAMIAANGTRFGGWLLNTADNCFIPSKQSPNQAPFPDPAPVSGSLFDRLVFEAGFEYDEKQGIFYSRIDPWQMNFGYFTLYDMTSPLAGMIIHGEPILFRYGGKSWKIELWKGQYGICTGAEIGIYTGEFEINTFSKDLNHVFNRLDLPDDTQCASGDDMLQMSFSLYNKNGLIFSSSRVFSRNSDNPRTSGIEKHWWLTGFKPFSFTLPSLLSMSIKIVLKDFEMRDRFVEGMVRLGYKRSEIHVNEREVSFIFDKPHTDQYHPF